MIFKHWDLQGALLCNVHLNSSHPVYTVQTTGGSAALQPSDCLFLSSHVVVSLVAEAGFLGLLSGLPEQLHRMFPTTTQQRTLSPPGRALPNVIFQHSSLIIMNAWQTVSCCSAYRHPPLCFRERFCHSVGQSWKHQSRRWRNEIQQQEGR